VYPVRGLHHLLPILLGSEDYSVPALVTAHRFIFDSRDEAAAERMQIVSRNGRPGALPHHLQLHHGLPARHPDHEGDRRVEDGVENSRSFNLTICRPEPGLPVRFANAGAKHLILVLKERKTLADMKYPFEQVRV
jgi:hypothetical protein